MAIRPTGSLAPFEPPTHSSPQSSSRREIQSPAAGQTTLAFPPTLHRSRRDLSRVQVSIVGSERTLFEPTCRILCELARESALGFRTEKPQPYRSHRESTTNLPAISRRRT